jgi:hypothetical protein
MGPKRNALGLFEFLYASQSRALKAQREFFLSQILAADESSFVIYRNGFAASYPNEK